MKLLPEFQVESISEIEKKQQIRKLIPGTALEFFKQEGALQFFSSNICLKIEKTIIKWGGGLRGEARPVRRA
jgi:hypothetical protein